MSETKFNLLPNIQFIYELHLAELELRSLLPKMYIEKLPDLRSFQIQPIYTPSNETRKISESIKDIEVMSNMLKQSAYVGEVSYIGEVDTITSDYAQLIKYNVTRAFNQYITHWFYPYKGKYHPQMVRSLANIIGLQPGDTLLDPFIGSGTTAVEGSLLNLEVIGFDVSPLCVLISNVKTNSIHHFEKIKQHYPKDALFQNHRNKDYGKNNNHNITECLDDPVESFGLLAKMIATSDATRRKRDFDKMLVKNENKMLESVQLMKDGCEEISISPTPAYIKVGDARHLPMFDESVDGIITSPPYSIALDYVENDAHSLESLGYDLKKIREEFVGVRGKGKEKIELYEQDMVQAYTEMARVLKPSGKIAIVIGDATVNGSKINTTQNCIDVFDKLGFKLVHNVNKLIYGLYNVMQQESILVFERG